jgi:uncharacterized repeat protein (TIGR03803 family)
MLNLSRASLAAVFTIWLILAVSLAQAQTFTAIHAFTGGTDGSGPYQTLVSDAEGNLYGTTFDGGLNAKGSVFKISPNGTFTTLHSFADGYGANPYVGLSIDSTGVLYGTTSDVTLLPPNFGVVFAFNTQTLVYSILYRFKGSSDGQNPKSGVVLADGSIYGTAGGGQYSAGVLYQLVAPPGGGTVWNQEVLHAFTGGFDGGGAGFNNVAVLPGGAIWGAAPSGGLGFGVLYELTQVSGGMLDFMTIYAFTGGADGGSPTGALIADKNGALYGANLQGGDSNGDGTVFKYQPGGSPAFLTLHTFTGGSDGSAPYSGVTLDSLGNVYGTASEGGKALRYQGDGSLFELERPQTGTTWTYKPLHVFSGLLDGANPNGGALLLSGGALYGAAYSGGGSSLTTGEGLIYSLTSAPLGLSALTLNSNTLYAGSSGKGTVTVTGIPGVPGAAVALTSSSPAVKLPASMTVNAGTTTGSFAINTTQVPKATSVTLTATLNGISKTAKLTIEPSPLGTLTFRPASVFGGNTTTATVTLSAPAPSGGTKITLSSSSSVATVPTSVTVPANGTSATFPIATAAVTKSTSATITCTLSSGATLAQTLTVSHYHFRS